MYGDGAANQVRSPCPPACCAARCLPPAACYLLPAPGAAAACRLQQASFAASAVGRACRRAARTPHPHTNIPRMYRMCCVY